MTLLISIICISIIIIFLRIRYENHALITQHFEVKNPKISNCLDGFRIAFLSDLHGSVFGEDNDDLIDAIRKNNPDIVLIGGDMLVGKPGETGDIALCLIKKLTKYYKVYYANGNHESRMRTNPDEYDYYYDTYYNQLQEMGVHHLCNDTMVIENHISISGLELEKLYYKKLDHIELDTAHITELIGKSSEEGFHILLAHNPAYFESYCRWGADLILSGHVHGGMVRLPFLGGVLSPQVKLFPKFDQGQFSYLDKTMILSPGLGSHTIKIRLFNRPSLCMITLRGIDQ